MTGNTSKSPDQGHSAAEASAESSEVSQGVGSTRIRRIGSISARRIEMVVDDTPEAADLPAATRELESLDIVSELRRQLGGNALRGPSQAKTA